MNVLDAFRLDDQAAIVTGGSKGLGYAIAEALAQAGANVLITSRTESEIDAAATNIAQATGRKVIPLVSDVCSEQEVHRLAETAIDTFGKIDIAVNNAGINYRSPAEDFPLTEYEKVVDVNLHGVYRVCQAVGRRMLAQGSG